MSAIYFYLFIVVIGLLYFFKMHLALSNGYFRNLYILRKKGEAKQIIMLEAVAYAWSLFWLVIFCLVLAYCAVMVLIYVDLVRYDIFFILGLFFLYFIRHAYIYTTAEFIKQRMVVNG